MQKTFIYKLVHPVTGEVRYIGKSNNLRNRLSKHMNCARRSTRRKINAWIKSLLNEGLKPQIKKIEECTIDKWMEREVFWIAFYRSTGADILNVCDGGIGGVGAGGKLKGTVKERVALIRAAIELMKMGETQSRAEKACGLHKGFLALVRKNKLPYLRGIEIEVPHSNRGRQLEGLRKNAFKKGENWRTRKRILP